MLFFTFGISIVILYLLIFLELNSNIANNELHNRQTVIDVRIYTHICSNLYTTKGIFLDNFCRILVFRPLIVTFKPSLVNST
jgi:hypothetical protein